PADIYNKTYQVPSRGGVLLKLLITEITTNFTLITQFKYTLVGGKIWYNILNINCVTNSYPF
ncbi:uncharacterized protein K441DRAFT_535188, partial [Cenococcum geophilum 1.58]|uniref:uncharacterized protein n=1 Tax=Cenococcum geophilum 1.58 TaxID=794803 RepID=UPI00358EDE15